VGQEGRIRIKFPLVLASSQYRPNKTFAAERKKPCPLKSNVEFGNMKRLFYFRITILLLVGATISGCGVTDYRLSGKWRSNLGLTTEYNEKHAQLTEKQKSVFSQIFGRTELTYLSPGKFEVFRPSSTIITGGKEIESNDSKKVMGYRVIFSNKDVVVISYDDPLFGETVRTLNFVDEDTYWIYGGDMGFFDLHIREYFTREK
jgi:hypothetical protein